MGKKKNKNKISGAVKTAAKTEKKLANKLKKELANMGEEDIAQVVAQIELEEAKRSAAKEKNLPGPPSPRAYASVTPHPTNNELIIFGGEYHDGQKTYVYNELLFFNPTSNTWRRVKAPGAPPPRSGHQAVATPANKGELWVFGGEFTSLSETQFYHYKDLWCYSLSENKWEKVVAANGPSARSGHRMVLLGRRLVVFGGYTDDGRECRYFDDVYSFCLDSRTWSRLAPSGRGPSPRSACVMVPAGNDELIVYGGFSRAREGRQERALTHSDLFRLSARADGGGGWAWRALPGGPLAPPPRAQLAAAVNTHSSRAYVFGGVTDVEETEEELVGEMSDDLRMLDLEAGKWHSVTLRTQQPARAPAAAPAPAPAANADADAVQEAVTVVTDEVFTMKLGGAAPAAAAAAGAGDAAPTRRVAPGPCPRMSAMMAVQRSVLYVYGGILEKDEKQFYLSDMYSLDLHKLSEWKTLVPQPPLPEWLGSDSDTQSGSDSDQDDSDTQSDQD
ncbi:kelch domain-containing protein 4 [Leguminivora glycinivorella]|uniref:kelch domain-containing protein 4 n=1 Tax=Leguminivora glycinivorella TaxID=1035111 RepID=UPI002010ADEE|nr:kelch domain-containing protein 4 [Leguminivora glycinivorella]